MRTKTEQRGPSVDSRRRRLAPCALAAALSAVAGAPAGAQALSAAERLERWIAALPEMRAALAAPQERRGLLQTQEILLRELRSMGYEPALEPIDWSPADWPGVPEGKTPALLPLEDGSRRMTLVDDPEPVRWSNIIVEIPGAQAPEEVVIVGAHFDAAPTTPGADDNASGVAGALEIARALRGVSLDRTVRIVFFNLEEIGLIGSRQHARNTLARVNAGEERVVVMLSLEMLGYYTDEPNSQRLPIPEIPGIFENPPTVGDFLAIVANQASAEAAATIDQAIRAASPQLKTFVADFIPATGWAMPDTRRSDHAPFWDIGVAAVLITDTSEFRTPHYHKESDTVETLDLARMALAVEGLIEAVKRLARVEEAQPQP